MLILLKWPVTAIKAIFEDNIDNKDLLPPLIEVHIPKLCYITFKPGGGGVGHKILMIAEDNLKLAVYWIQHQISVSQPWDLADIDTNVLNNMCQQRDLKGQISLRHLAPQTSMSRTGQRRLN